MGEQLVLEARKLKDELLRHKRVRLACGNVLDAFAKGAFCWALCRSLEAYAPDQ